MSTSYTPLVWSLQSIYLLKIRFLECNKNPILLNTKLTTQSRRKQKQITVMTIIFQLKSINTHPYGHGMKQATL